MIYDGAALDIRLHGVVTDPRTYLLRFYPKLPIPPLDRVATDGPPLVAEIREGLWIARCSCRTRVTARNAAGPGGVVWLDNPVIWCPRCRNNIVGGMWRRVILPADIETIEQVLLARPDVQTRNWLPAESVDDLVQENTDHGLEAA